MLHLFFIRHSFCVIKFRKRTEASQRKCNYNLNWPIQNDALEQTLRHFWGIIRNIVDFNIEINSALEQTSSLITGSEITSRFEQLIPAFSSQIELSGLTALDSENCNRINGSVYIIQYYRFIYWIKTVHTFFFGAQSSHNNYIYKETKRSF